MDRNKPLPGTRGPKGKITQQPPDMFIALGAKQSSPRDDPKRSVPLPKTSVNNQLVSSSSKVPSDKLKREPSSSSLSTGPPSKKLKVNIPGSRPGISGPSTPNLLPERHGPVQSGAEPWELMAIDCDPSDIFETAMNAVLKGSLERGVGYILGAIKYLKNQRGKLCKVSYSSLFLLCSCKPALFTNDTIVMAVLSVLRREVSGAFKGPNKGVPVLSVIFTNLLTHAFGRSPHWPESFVKLYVEDAVTDRVIIDNPFCKPFVDNIVTAFNTKLPPSSLLKYETWTLASRDTSSPLTINTMDEDDSTLNEHRALVEGWNVKVCPRYTDSQETIEQIVLEAIKEQLARRQQPEAITKNFVRFLSTACGLVEIRIIAVSRIETWLHNHKLMKPAQELLAYLCYNCSANSQRDLEVIVQLSKLRLKNKPMLSFFNNCLKEMVVNSPENLFPLLKYTIYNELSNARNTNNLIVVGALFQVAPEASAKAFADICLELLLNKDDYLRSLRALLKEINRVLRHEFNLLSIVHALLRERPEFIANVSEHEFRERIFLSLADLASMCMLLCVSPQVRDAASQSKRDPLVLKAFQAQVSNIQRECIIWIHESSIKVFRPNISDFHHVLLKVLFLEQAEHYYKIDSWPGENERNLFLRLASEVPLLQETLVRIFLIALKKDTPLTSPEAVEIADQLIKRAANLPPDCAQPIVVDRIDIFDFCFNLCSYNYPGNITLPAGYDPPKLAISNLYWKVWFMLLILSAHNPVVIGSLAWEKYPILRMFMEMCITNHFSFPPPTTTLDEDYHTKEQQTLTLEKQRILEFECHLAAASTKAEINEQTSLLLPQLMELNPQELRRPPQQVLDQLQALNNSHRLGHLLCRSRHPDFLLDIMSRQGGTAHMPWLAELVHSSEGALAHLPVQCLCEYLLSTTPTEKLTKHGQLLAHLRTVVNGNDPQVAFEVLEYLFRRLTSDHGASRSQATKGLGLILAPSDETEVGNENQTNWLTSYISQFPHFSLIKPALVQFLRQALQIETNPSRVSSYINFLATQESAEFIELHDLITDLTSVIIERHSVASYVLPGEDNVTLKNLLQIFNVFTKRAMEFDNETCKILESYNIEHVVVTWPSGEQCGLQPVVIHATIVLLTYGPLEDFEPFNSLMNIWFPVNSDPPKAFSVADATETVFLPDWMKLRMIRSNVPRLVDAAIDKLEPPKLVLFIQSFGIPTSSISKLLKTLDKATLMDPKLVVDSVLDKSYMIQLVEVQNKRGAVGGETFVKAIESQAPVVPDVDVQVDVDPKTELPQKARKTTSVASDYEVVQTLNNLLNPHFEQDKNKLILGLVKTITFRRSVANTVIDFFLKVHLEFLLPLVLNFSSIANLFQLILSPPPIAKEKLSFAQRLLQIIPDGSNCTAIALRKIIKDHTKEEEKMEVDPIDIIGKSKIISGEKLESFLGASENVSLELKKMLLVEGKAEKSGLLVDWLTAVELEIANSSKNKIQFDLLFSKQEMDCRPLLMSLVLQRASWKSLHSIMTYLLQEESSDVCPVSALDFFTALTQSPKLWQGRDKAIPKHCHEEDVLQLNTSQVLKMVHYILEEAVLHEKDWKSKMQSRLEVLLKCIASSAIHIVRFLSSRAETDDRARELLLMIYMSLPYSGQNSNENCDIFKEAYSKTCPSAMDEISHSILSALAATPRSAYWSRKSADLELCARKLAATHPALVLRQLPMLAGSLKGRAQYEWGVLKSRGHLMLFTQILGILELLQPYVFEQSETLCELLDSYFLLLQFHGHGKELTVLVNRIVVFVQKWMTKDIRSASKYLQEHGGVLNEIQFSQPSVRPLLTSVSLPIHDSNAPTELLVGSAAPLITEQLPPNWTQLTANLHCRDNLNALQELDHLTSKKPQFLETVAQQLYNSITSPNSATRTVSLQLIVRWLKHNPKAASEALPSILSALDSNNGDIVDSILDRLSELVIVMQDYAQAILTRAFQLGMKSTLNTTNNITKAIDMLSLQHGCCVQLVDFLDYEMDN